MSLLESNGAATIATIGTPSLTTEYQDFLFNYTGTGSYDIFLHRLSSASSANQSIFIKSVSVIEIQQTDIPRLDYTNGTASILLEPQRFNGITYSNNFDGTNMINSAIITEFNTTETLSPEGINNSSKLTANSDFQRYSFYPTIGDNVDVSVSVFAKKGSASVFKMLIIDKSGQAINDTFDLLNVTTLDGIGKIENYGNGWYRCSITASTSSGATAFQIRPFSHGAGYDNGWTGSNYIYGFGAQYEAGSYATSYIPTSGSAVTRIADASSQTVPNGVIGQTEGTLFAAIDFKYNNSTGDTRICSIWDSGSTEVVSIWARGNALRYQYFDSNTSVNIENSITATQGVHKLALSYNGNNLKVYMDGSVITNTNMSASANLNSNNLGFARFWGNQVIDHQIFIKQATVFNTALTSAELASLTTI